MILLLLACSDNNFAEVKLDAIATSMGDFDDVSQVLLSQDIGSAPYNGYIVQGTWDTSDTAPTREDPGNTVEQLVTTDDEKGDWIIGSFNAVFINSGTRGLGASVYNDPTTPDERSAARAESDCADQLADAHCLGGKRGLRPGT